MSTELASSISVQILPRILRDMNDGVLALDRNGHILFINNRGKKLLHIQKDIVGKTYAAVFMSGNDCAANDGFHQFVLDAVYEKETLHKGIVGYQTPTGQKLRFSLNTSFLLNEEGNEDVGIIIVITDVTEIEKLRQQSHDATTVFTELIVYVCLYLFFWSILRYFHAELPTWQMSIIIEGIALIMFFIILKTTSFSMENAGLSLHNPKKTLLTDIAIAGGAIIFFAGLKDILLHTAPGFFPSGLPFWNWGKLGLHNYILYAFTAVLQEFLARGTMQESLYHIFSGKHKEMLSIIVSALIFGVLHVAHGLPFMVGASALLGVLGVLYNKQRSIWGVAIIHYVLGLTATLLGFL